MTPRVGYGPGVLRQAPVWAADTGCFSPRVVFSLERYLEWLQAHRAFAATCLFATAPDVVGDAAATMERSRPVLPLIRVAGYPAALVGQDGLEALSVPWDELDWLFVGGTTAWKLGPAACRLAKEARRRGKGLHMGRVNSARRLLYARSLDCDSTDGTHMAFNPRGEALDRLGRWLAAANALGPAAAGERYRNSLDGRRH